MVYNRTGYAPWSLTREAGVQSATVDGTIEVPQYIQPTIDTGFVDIKGNWQGVRSSDENFFAITRHEGIPNTGVTLNPDTPNFPSIDMTGFKDLLIAIKTSSGGNYQITAIMGPDTTTFANLSPVAAGVTLKMMFGNEAGGFQNMANDSAEVLTADAWEIFKIQNRVGGIKNLQFKVINNSGSNADFEVGFMRLV